MQDETLASRSLHLAIQVPSRRPRERRCSTGRAYPLVRVRGSQVGARAHGHGQRARATGTGNGQSRAGRAERAGTAALCMALCMVCKAGKSRLVQGSTVTSTSTTTTTNVARTVDSAEERMSCNKAAQRDLGHPAQPRRLLLVLDQWFHYNQAVRIQVCIQG